MMRNVGASPYAYHSSRHHDQARWKLLHVTLSPFAPDNMRASLAIPASRYRDRAVDWLVNNGAASAFAPLRYADRSIGDVWSEATQCDLVELFERGRKRLVRSVLLSAAEYVAVCCDRLWVHRGRKEGNGC